MESLTWMPLRKAVIDHGNNPHAWFHLGPWSVDKGHSLYAHELCLLSTTLCLASTLCSTHAVASALSSSDYRPALGFVSSACLLQTAAPITPQGTKGKGSVYSLRETRLSPFFLLGKVEAGGLGTWRVLSRTMHTSSRDTHAQLPTPSSTRSQGISTRQKNLR